MARAVEDCDERIFEKMWGEIAAARIDVLTASEPDAIWTCQHCGHQMKSPKGDWMAPDELRRQANPPLKNQYEHKHAGTVVQLALHQLINEGILALNNRLQVRRVK